MRRFLAIFLIIFCIGLNAGCVQNKKADVTAADANEFLTEFFASYTQMNDYLKKPEIAISAFALDGAGLSSILKAVYQAQSVTYTFSEPVEVSDNIFTAVVEVTAPNIQPLYEMYAIDRQLAGDDVDKDFVAQSFYDNIRSGTTSSVTTAVSVTIHYNNGKWTIDPSNDLAFGIFPNIDKAY